jgi:hypothetical protein
MTQEKATKRPWSVSVETEAEDGLTITIPEIGRCLHDWEWADAEEWERDLANADLIVTAVNERDALLSEVAKLRAETLKGICVYCGYIEQYESLEQKASEEGNAMRVAHIRQCEARPEAKLIAYAEELQTVLRAAKDALRSYEYGNASPDLAKAIADKADEALAPPCWERKGNGDGK